MQVYIQRIIELFRFVIVFFLKKVLRNQRNRRIGENFDLSE